MDQEFQDINFAAQCLLAMSHSKDHLVVPLDLSRPFIREFQSKKVPENHSPAVIVETMPDITSYTNQTTISPNSQESSSYMVARILTDLTSIKQEPVPEVYSSDHSDEEHDSLEIDEHDDSGIEINYTTTSDENLNVNILKSENFNPGINSTEVNIVSKVNNINNNNHNQKNNSNNLNNNNVNGNVKKYNRKVTNKNLNKSSQNLRKTHKCSYEGCHKVYGKSSHLKAHLRTHTVKDLQYKWKNLRDCYTRNQRLIQEQKMTQTGKPIKPYTYARHLKFLEALALTKEFVKSRMEPILDFNDQITIEPAKKRQKLTNENMKCEIKSNSESVNEILIPTYESENQYEDNRVELREDSLVKDENEEVNTSKNDDSLLMSYITQQQSQYYQQLQRTQQILNNSFKEENDDIQFFKSLLPTLQTLSLDQKLSFRIECMKLLAKYLEDSKT